MFQKDFILRMIEMMGDLITGLLGLIKKGEYPKVQETLENAYDEFLKEDAAFFRRIPMEKLSRTLLEEHNYNRGHLEILSQLFFAEAELNYAQKNKDISLEYYQKALSLMDFVLKEEKTFSMEKTGRLEAIKLKIIELKGA